MRVRFSRSREVKYVSHLDMMRMWDRTLRRAGIEVIHSEGFTPHPKIALGAPLPIGTTSEAELMDVHLAKPVSPHHFIKTVSAQLPQGLSILEVEQVPIAGPSLQSRMRFAEYRVELKAGLDRHGLQEKIDSLMRADTFPWQHLRDTGPRSYDLRPLIDSIWIVRSDDQGAALGMRLRSDPQKTGRPDQVLAALGLNEHVLIIHRTRLILEEQ